jgi:hypothetical protein
MTRILGNSNANIEFFLDAEKKFVRKTCYGESAKRLLKQIRKQQSYVPFNDILTPKVYDVVATQEKTVVDMEYARGLDFVSYTSYVDGAEFKETFSLIVEFLEKEFFEAKISEFPSDVWKSKVKSILFSLNNREDVDKSLIAKCCDYLLDDIPAEIKIGNCHGDLTFSNMIISEESKKLYVFDFLDPPIETPYEDMAKILQDAEFFWSLQKYVGSCDATRVKIMWESAAKTLKQKIHHDTKILKKFQVLGMLRIAPYTRDVNNVSFIQDSLRRLIKCY